MQVVTATLLIIGYFVSAAWVFPLVLPVLLVLLAFMWLLNARHSDRVQTHSQDYVDATTALHQRYEDWVAISRIASLGVDSDNLADRFESGARKAASHVVSYTRSSAATQISYQLALVGAFSSVCRSPGGWRRRQHCWFSACWLSFACCPVPGIQVGYQGIINAVAPLQAIDRLARTGAGPCRKPTAGPPSNGNDSI